MKDRIITGSYNFVNSEFIPDKNMRLINAHLNKMKFLVTSMTTEIPAFYYDEKENQYWMCWEYENHTKTIEPVTRKYIEENYPTVDCDKLVDLESTNSTKVISNYYLGKDGKLHEYDPKKNLLKRNKSLEDDLD